MLCDTGPLIALIDEDDPHHARCSEALTYLPPRPLITTWPCLTEAMYFMGRFGGYPAQERLWVLFDKGFVILDQGSEPERVRIRELMRQYRDTPMDLADASLVAIAETLGLRRIFTLDHHFRAYRIRGVDTFEIVP